MRQGICAVVAAVLLAATGAAAQDYEREKRWAEEVVPGLVVGEAAWLENSRGRKFLGIYAPVRDARFALVVVHGVGLHPDHGMIGVLRSRLTDLGHTTLSIQMPVLGTDKGPEDYYPALFPEAADRIGRAAEWMRARGHDRVVLVTHSMGAWMANEYLAAAPQSPYVAWVCMGLTGGFNWRTYFSTRPILDIYGELDHPLSVDAAWRRRVALATTEARSRQVMIAGGDHFYARREAALAMAIDEWLRQSF